MSLLVTLTVTVNEADSDDRAIANPKVSEEAKVEAAEKLEDMTK